MKRLLWFWDSFSSLLSVEICGIRWKAAVVRLEAYFEECIIRADFNSMIRSSQGGVHYCISHDAGLIKDHASTLSCGSYSIWIRLTNANGINLSGTEMFCHLLIMLWEDDLFGFIFKLSLFSYLSHFSNSGQDRRLLSLSLSLSLTCLGALFPYFKHYF